MSKHIFILVIPGTGVKKAGFSDGLQKDLNKHTKKTTLKDNFTVLEYRPFHESGVDQNQEELFRRMKSRNRLGGILSFRKTVLHLVGDAVLFDRDIRNPNSAYQFIHQKLKTLLEEIHQSMKNYDQTELVILASSIGVYVLSCYIWDADHSLGIFYQTLATPENNLRDLSYLATIGCNIPMYVSALKEKNIVPIERRNQKFTWDNFYDKDDVLGWPLQPLSYGYNELVTDFEINSGAYVGSHFKYWNNNNFTKPFTEKLVKLFEA